MCIYISIYIHVYIDIHIYIYIERERGRYVFYRSRKVISSFPLQQIKPLVKHQVQAWMLYMHARASACRIAQRAGSRARTWIL